MLLRADLNAESSNLAYARAEASRFRQRFNEALEGKERASELVSAAWRGLQLLQRESQLVEDKLQHAAQQLVLE